jgi:hypothetical protein
MAYATNPSSLTTEVSRKVTLILMRKLILMIQHPAQGSIQHMTQLSDPRNFKDLQPYNSLGRINNGFRVQ